MARNIEEILKEQLGNLVFQLSIVQSQVEELKEANVKMKVELEKSKSEEVTK